MTARLVCFRKPTRTAALALWPGVLTDSAKEGTERLPLRVRLTRSKDFVRLPARGVDLRVSFLHEEILEQRLARGEGLVGEEAR